MITVNAMGDNCPIPVIKTKKAMAALTGPETIEVLVDNEIAVQNVTKMASSSGGKVTSEKLGDAEYKVTIEMEGAPAADGAEAVCAPDARDNTVVVVSSDRMGSGNDGGATLTTEGSDSLEDLKSLEAQGVEIMTCGTCLDYYGLKDKLAVGTVTNMYSIVETMAKAGRIVRPS